MIEVNKLYQVNDSICFIPVNHKDYEMFESGDIFYILEILTIHYLDGNRIRETTMKVMSTRIGLTTQKMVEFLNKKEIQPYICV